MALFQTSERDDGTPERCEFHRRSAGTSGTDNETRKRCGFRRQSLWEGEGWRDWPASVCRAGGIM